MAENIVINGKTYNGVETVVLTNEDGDPVAYTIAANVPSYWRNHVDSKTDSIRSKQNAAGDRVFQFVWLSDVHGVAGYNNTSNGAGKSETTNIGKVAQYAAKKFGVPFVVVSGDIMSQSSHTAESNVWNEYSGIWDIFDHVDIKRLLMIKGNHDGAWGAPVDGVYYLKNTGDVGAYNAIYRKQATDRQRVFGPGGTYFYVDSPQRVRVIMLNSHTDGDGSNDSNGYAVYNPMKNSVYGQEQLDWFAESLKTLPEDWSAVVVSHVPLATSLDGALVAGLINAYNKRTVFADSITITANYWGTNLDDTTYKNISVSADFAEVLGLGGVVGFFYGHIHKDDIDTTSYSFPCISITTAGGDVRDVNPVKRVGGTVTETAMDVVSIDLENKRIYCTRLGAGYDRECNYTGYTEPVAYTNQIPISTDTDGSVFNGTGYQASARINSSGVVKALTSGTSPAFVTGFIPVKPNSTIRFKNCWMDADGTAAVYGEAVGGFNQTSYDSGRVRLGSATWDKFVPGYTTSAISNCVFDENGNCIGFDILNYYPNLAFMRFTLAGDPATAIVTVNEEIKI